MLEVHIWPTLAGVVALTPDEFGFSFCANKAEVDKLRADLQAGVPMARTVGFSGSSCLLRDLVRVESKRGSPTILVVAREFLGKATEDFTFQKQGDRQEFYDTLLHLLGPTWKCENVLRRRGPSLLLLIAGLVLGALLLSCGGLLVLLPPSPDQQKGGASVTGAEVGMMGIGLLLTAGCVAAMLWAGTATWQIIRESPLNATNRTRG